MIKLTCAASAALLACVAQAQVVLPPSADPGALQQRRIEEEQRRQDQERLERRPLTDPIRQEAPPRATAPLPSSVRFTVKEIRFDPPSEILRAEELKALAQPYEGKEVGLADLQQLVERINGLYQERGVVTARALIAPQDVTSGVFTIRLVEGRLGNIAVTGNDSTRESYILARVQAEPGQLVDLPALQESLVRFNRTNDAQLRAELKPGQAFGRSDLEIGVVEPSRHTFRLGLDNLGSEVTGKNRVALSYTNQSLFGWRDTLNLGAMSASGLKSVSFDYGVPTSRSGGRLNLAINQDDTKIKNGPFASLGITGESTTTALSLRQPVYLGARSQTDLLASLRKREVENRISGVFLSSTDADDFQLGVEHQATDDSGQWVAGYSLYNGRAITAGERQRYTVGRGSVRRAHFFSNHWILRGNLSFQHTSSDELPTGDYFFLGGEGSVRGYPVGVLSGDQGTLLSLELQHPITDATDASGGTLAANGFFFLDTGHVKLVLPPDSTLAKSKTLSSIGWGVNVSVGRNVSARITLAHALTKLADEDRYTLRFQLSSQF